MIVKVVLMLAILIVCILLKVPVFLSLAMSVSSIALCFPEFMRLEILGQGLVQGLNSYSYAGVVFFFFAGEIMSSGGISRRLINFFDAAVGHIRGGLSHVNVLESMVFAGMSGSALADTAATSAIMVPAMVEQGYSPEYATAITIASSCIGPIIPPSTGLILLAVYTGANTLRCLMGGLVPGICMGIVLLVASFTISRKRNYPKGEWRGWKYLGKAFIENLLALLLPVLIVYALSTGLGTVNEVGAISCLYAIIISVFVYKDIDLRGLLQAVIRAAQTAGKMLCIIGMAGIFTWIVGSLGLRGALNTLMQPYLGHPHILLCISMVLMLILGMFLDHTVIMFVIAPIMAPILVASGVDLVQFCVLTMIVCTMGLVTPPVGMLIYIGSSVSGAKPVQVVRELIPFIITLVILVIILIFVPAVTTWLPGVLYG